MTRATYKRVLWRVRDASWVFLNENLSREELMALVSKHRYGIHGMPDEHFGVAVAEMVKAGCIVFVPHRGGQVEIAGKDERLVYGGEDEAVSKIVRIMNNPEEQTSLRSYLGSRKELFSAERFMNQIREIVRQFQGTAPVESPY